MSLNPPLEKKGQAPEKASLPPNGRLPWLILVGPTAVGKTAVAEALALELRTDILVADSRQVYRGMDIGTEKPSPEARRRVARHLIDLVSPDQLFSAGMYREQAALKVAELEGAGKVIFIEGGTGLYIKALLDGLWQGPPADWPRREALLQKEQEEGEGTLHRMLSEVDPLSGNRIHFRDTPKIVRALEVYQLTGRTLSEIHAEHRSTLLDPPPSWQVGLRRERRDLYRRIEARVEEQIASGLIEETERFLSAGLSPSLPSMRGLGYKQMVPYLQGKQSLDEAVSILKRDTRRYAKRQLTWFQADPRIEWIDLGAGEGEEEAVARIKNLKNYRIML
ncbi:MAG TPA: tRNA (adenosine(37)-N6)-dimethylallyltransferase MiaA [Candidatus Manganitrophaceae bacterium]|nr:tRNA (adenosine(37)-N6)-dimethylallyltransferase MiaA [Candidatus Manganitrophaceae bacterium]